MNVPEKHRTLAHAWIDGAKIQYETVEGNWITANIPNWKCKQSNFRINPLCDYAINKIPERHREAYKAFHEGKPIEIQYDGHGEWDDWCIKSEPCWTEVDNFRPKPTKIKRWQWLYKANYGPRVWKCFMTYEEAVRALGVDLIRKIEETEREYDE